MLETKVTGAVVSELLTASDVKDALRITFTDDDTYITGLIVSARQAIEKYCGIAIGAQTITCTVDLNAWEEVEIPYGPIDTVTASYKSDFNEYTTAIAFEDYDTDGEDYKTFTPFTSGRWKLVYDCGYTTLPADLKNAWLRLIAWYYENRGDTGTIPASLKPELINYRRLFWL